MIKTKAREAVGGGKRRTIPLWPDAGEQLGLSRNGTYDAAKRGEIPTLRFGKKLVVPIEQFERLLTGE
jgi:Helix-turn-helix domain